MRGSKPKGRTLPAVTTPPATVKKIPPPPLQLSGEALRFYNTEGQRLWDSGILTQSTVAAFALGCEAWAELAEATARLRKEGPSVKSKRGSKLSPQLSIVRENRRFLISFLGEFGMTPIGQRRLGAISSTGGGNNALDLFIAKQSQKKAQG